MSTDVHVTATVDEITLLGAASETTLAALLAANHTDLLALGTVLAAVLAKQSADPSTGAKQDTLHADLAELVVLHADLAALLAKESADPSTGANQTAANTKLDTLHADLAALLAKLIAAPATEAKQDALITANHTDLAALLTSLGLTTDLSSALTAIGLLKAIKAAITGTVLVAPGSVVRTGYTYTNGQLTSYTENGVVWTIARNGDGTIASVTHA